MITLATLGAATAQQVFDQVATHLLTQGVRSTHLSTKSCAYRGQRVNKVTDERETLMCAAGCLMSDKEYAATFKEVEGEGESLDWTEAVGLGLVPDQHCALIADLQAVHDHHSVMFWMDELSGVAEKNGLEFNAK